MVGMNGILVPGSATNESIIRTLPITLDEFVKGRSCFTTYRGPEILEATLYRFIKAQSNVTTCAFGDLFDILGGIQQQLRQDDRSMPQLWETSIFMQGLETWLQSLPNELLLPTMSGSQRTNRKLMENTINNAPGARKVELLHLYSLYFGILNLLMCPSLQQVVTVDLNQSMSLSKEERENAYKCLNYATRSIDLCVAFYNVSSFPVFAWLPQCILFSSSLISVLGILWQRRLLAGKSTTSSQEWLDQSNRNLRDVLHIFEYCGLRNEQCQRHYLVLQQIFLWLREGTDLVSMERSELIYKQ
ncbi:hypothetical protein F5882DRAFT_423394 [Hyaloscypha sp. PMI_1271]|nr:hypothetical protein F5882DRAFT_423394 [Hyaloscypha sp. PMI_1271]